MRKTGMTVLLHALVKRVQRYVQGRDYAIICQTAMFATDSTPRKRKACMYKALRKKAALEMRKKRATI